MTGWRDRKKQVFCCCLRSRLYIQIHGSSVHAVAENEFRHPCNNIIIKLNIITFEMDLMSFFLFRSSLEFQVLWFWYGNREYIGRSRLVARRHPRKPPHRCQFVNWYSFQKLMQAIYRPTQCACMSAVNGPNSLNIFSDKFYLKNSFHMENIPVTKFSISNWLLRVMPLQ